MNSIPQIGMTGAGGYAAGTASGIAAVAAGGTFTVVDPVLGPITVTIPAFTAGATGLQTLANAYVAIAAYIQAHPSN